MKKRGTEKLDVNLLVPFTGHMASEIKGIAVANGLPNTIVIRMLISRGLEAVRNGEGLRLVIPFPRKEDVAQAS
jgi:hypothetical protein